MRIHHPAPTPTDTLGRRRRTSKNGTHIVTPRGLAERTGESGTTIWRAYTKYGTLPRPVRISAGRVGWPIDIIERLERAATVDERKAIVRAYEAARESTTNNPAA